MSQETPLFAKTYDLLAYLLPAVEKFPRSQRAVLGRRLQEVSLGFLDLLLTARKSPSAARGALLRQADLELDRLRYTVRLCHDLTLFTDKQYRYLSGLLAEVGRLLGTWLKGYNTP
ncbi:MAG TPA: diversity-generating retroelement protein Avd [Anaerolineaceae bacterium]|nr:diversity-generating retroelement protein Avd [Anaerolineaceae bacterium]